MAYRALFALLLVLLGGRAEAQANTCLLCAAPRAGGDGDAREERREQPRRKGGAVGRGEPEQRCAHQRISPVAAASSVPRMARATASAAPAPPEVTAQALWASIAARSGAIRSASASPSERGS